MQKIALGIPRHIYAYICVYAHMPPGMPIGTSWSRDVNFEKNIYVFRISFSYHCKNQKVSAILFKIC